MKNKFRKIDYLILLITIFAASLCVVGSPLAPYCFVVSSVFGLLDSYNHKLLAPSLINGIFLTMNLILIMK